MRPASPVRLFTCLLPVLLAASILGSGAGLAQENEAVRARDVPKVKETQRDLMWIGARRHFARATAEKAKAKDKKKSKVAKGQKVRKVVFDEDVAAGRLVKGRATAAPERAMVLSQPTNVPVNNPGGDDPAAGQAEQSVAMLGQYGLNAWNDGQGFVVGPHTQGVAYTTNGGATWVDAGDPPTAGATGGTIGAWTSDPVVTVNEKTGEFYYCGLIDGPSSTNGIAIVGATFPGGVFTWDTPRVVVLASNNTDFYDKQWMVADSTNGNLYLTYTHFVVGGNSIEFRRSINWGAPITLSSPAGAGFVQGSRPAVGPGGEVYAIWREIGPIDVDFIRSRRSTNAGVSFGSENTPASFYDNFGTGAPGFNRERSVFNPAPAVDRSTGPNRGRFYVTWNEAINWYNDPLGGLGNRGSATEAAGGADNFFARATPFTPGHQLHGRWNTAFPADLDYFSFTGTAGTSYIFWCDSLNPSIQYTMRIFCTDTTTRLAFGGDLQDPGGGNAFIVFTAPANGTYYLRMAFAAGTILTNYRVQTGVNTPGPERGRDQRDVFVNYSDNGGTSWSTPTRVNSEAGLYDDWLPEVAVTCEGYPYVMWYDWRDSPANCAGSSHIYAARSTNGGSTWSTNQRVTTALTPWTFAASNIAPNQGDYNGFYGGDQLAFSWADGRTGNVDVRSANLEIGYSLGCRADTTVTPGSKVNLLLPMTNPNVLFNQSLSYELKANRTWPGLPSAGGVVVPENETSWVPFSVSIPDTAANGPVRVCLRVSLANGVKPDSCCFVLNVQSSVSGVESPGASFALDRIGPNPTAGDLTVMFSLPDGAPATLDLIDINGRRVLHHEVGSLGPGRHVVSLSAETRRLPIGVYAVRLSRGGRALTSKVSILR